MTFGLTPVWLMVNFDKSDMGVIVGTKAWLVALRKQMEVIMFLLGVGNMLSQGEQTIKTRAAGE